MNSVSNFHLDQISIKLALGNEQATFVIGGGKGDEGKGGDAYTLALYGDYQGIVSAVGGPNAGHTAYDNGGRKFVGHNLPGGAFSGKPVFLGQGKYIGISGLRKELLELKSLGVTPKVYIAKGAHLLLDSFHKIIDTAIEKNKGKNAVGTTGSGMGPGVAARALRDSIQICQLSHISDTNIDTILDQLMYPWSKDIGLDRDAIKRDIAEQRSILQSLISEGVIELVGDDFAKNMFQAGDKLLIEGAQSPSLGMYGGAYPNNTSTDTSFLGNLSTLGINPIPGRVGQILTVKLFPSAVGNHTFPERVSHVYPDLTEQEAEFGRQTGEYGASTGRPRQVAFPSPALVGQYIRDNYPYVSMVSIRKLDVLQQFRDIIGLPELPVVVGYDDDRKPQIEMMSYAPKALIAKYREAIESYTPGLGDMLPMILGNGPRPQDSQIQLPHSI